MSDPDEEVDGTIEWVDEEAPEEAEPPTHTPKGDPFEAARAEMLAQAATRPRKRPPSVSKPDPHSQNGRGKSTVTAPVPVHEPFDFGNWARANRNPLLFAAVILLIVGAVSFRVWRMRLAELPVVAERGRVEGLAALDAGKFETAYQLLSEARRAVIRLGDDIPGASAIKQGADEAEVIAKLVSDPLEQLLDEASRDEPAAWDDRFRKLYDGRTILIEAEVTAVPNSQGEGSYDLNYRIFPEGEGAKPRSIGKLNLNGFKHFDLIKPKLHDTVVFGADPRFVPVRHDRRDMARRARARFWCDHDSSQSPRSAWLGTDREPNGG